MESGESKNVTFSKLQDTAKPYIQWEIKTKAISIKIGKQKSKDLLTQFKYKKKVGRWN